MDTGVTCLQSGPFGKNGISQNDKPFVVKSDNSGRRFFFNQTYQIYNKRTQQIAFLVTFGIN